MNELCELRSLDFRVSGISSLGNWWRPIPLSGSGLLLQPLDRAPKRHNLFPRKRRSSYFFEWSNSCDQVMLFNLCLASTSSTSRDAAFVAMPIRIQSPCLLGPISKFAPKEPIMQCLKGHKTAHRSQMIKPLRRALFLDRNFPTM